MSTHIDIAALSGIAGSISIACWVVVFSPQIIENFRRSSAEGLSIVFLVIWLAGDVFNILGAVLQGVLPTMIILAVYYTLADIVLILQCFYYKGFTLSDKVPPKPDLVANDEANERSALLNNEQSRNTTTETALSPTSSNFRERLSSMDGHHLSPATPLHNHERDTNALKAQSPVQTTASPLKSFLFNVTSILVVCAAGALGWYLSQRTSRRHQHRHHGGSDDYYERLHPSEEDLNFSVLGQVFGYICAVLYLGSRLPQLLLNYRRKSTEGISMLFFLFACIGNATYVVSILAFDPICHHPGRCKEGEVGHLYARNFLVNFSWLLGSFGTLFLDACVFLQYFLYKKSSSELTGNGHEQSAAVDS